MSYKLYFDTYCQSIALVAGYRQYFDTYCQSIGLVWKIDPNRRGGRVARYLAKGLLHPVASLKWAIVLKIAPGLRVWFRRNPRLLLKPSRPYISRHYNFGLRVKVIFNHYATLARVISQLSFESLAQGNCIVLATLTGKSGGRYQITLGKTDKFDREGELVLQLRDCTQCREVFSFAFSFNIYEDCTGVEIGCIQGPRSDDARELIKRATKELYGIRPRNLLADALYALAAIWNITVHSGVCNNSRVYNGDTTQADYDAFWIELGGTLGENGMFCLPAVLHHHQLTEVPSHHRSEYRRRLEIREALGMQISMAARSIGTTLQ